jgi:hypothetical protein
MRKQEDMLYPIFFGPPLFKVEKEGLEHRLGLEIWLMTFSSNETELLQLYNEFEDIVENKRYQ